MDKNSLISQLWDNRNKLGLQQTKTQLKNMSFEELQTLQERLIADESAAAESCEETSAPSAFSPEIRTVVNKKGVEIPVVYLPLAKVEGMSLYFQFGEQFVCVSNINYVVAFDKGLIQLGELMPFNFNLGINSFTVGIGGHLQAIAQTVTAEERNALTADEKLAGKLLTSFVAGFASEQAVAKERSMQIAMIKAEAVNGLKGAERKAVQAEITAEIVDIKVSQVRSKLKALLAI